MKNDPTLVAASILSADFGALAREVEDVTARGADWIHVDVMDGQFVPNLTIGPDVVGAIRRHTRLPLDVHLMIEEPERYLEAFRKAGADFVTVHVEARGDCAAALAKIRALGARPGISLRPATPLAAIEPYLTGVDLVLLMTVEPGFGGQAFRTEVLEKVKALSARFSGLISVDGGINQETGALARGAGARVLVAGTYIFRSPDRARAIASLRGHDAR